MFFFLAQSLDDKANRFRALIPYVIKSYEVLPRVELGSLDSKSRVLNHYTTEPFTNFQHGLHCGRKFRLTTGDTERVKT